MISHEHSPPVLDLDPESREVLEFDPLLALVSTYARTRIGARNVLETPVLSRLDDIRERHRLLREAMAHLERRGRIVSGFVPDPAQGLARLKVPEERLESEELRDLARVAVAAGETGAALAGLPRPDYPGLQAAGEAVPDLLLLVGSVLECIGPDGELTDDASRELRRIRQAIARNGRRLRQILEQFLHRPDTGAVMQDEFVTQRNGRFVLPVRADAPRRLQGIVHATSSSGATLFVEPLETVELNNEQVRLGEQEAEEQDRILAGWSDDFRNSLADLEDAASWIGRLDGLQARAEFGREAGGVVPEVREGGDLILNNLRHPLLDRRLREHGGACVPLRFRLEPADQVLVISGPNTGGKTVAIKTLGLAVLMAQAGVPVPADRADLPLYGQVRADIGDHQSIEADLSTFSAHLAAVARFLRRLQSPALLLFDEIGTGTEPSEGAALAQAVLEELRVDGVTGVATTHFGRLKAWAYTTEGAASAAMEFDEETLKPTFRVTMDAAGVSAGIDIAGRLGLPDRIVGQARALLGEDTRQTEAFLSRLRELTAGLEADRDELEQARAQLARERDQQQIRADSEKERIRRESARKLDEALKEFRSLARQEIEGIRDRKRRDRELRAQDRAEGRLEGLVPEEVRAPEAGGRPLSEGELSPGREVLVRSLGRRGKVVRVRGEVAEVLLGKVGFKVQVSDLAAPEAEEAPAGKPAPRRSFIREEAARRRSPESDASSGPGPGLELMLLGKTVDEALEVVDRFLDRALLGGLQEVRIVHGHGTGRLKAAVRRFVQDHPRVLSHRPGRTGEGGDGATVVRLDG